MEALRRAHSYEEPAYDVYPLRPTFSRVGDGRLGKLPRPTPLAEIVQSVRERLHAGTVQFVAEAGRVVERAAIVCGAGGTLLDDALAAGADLFLTGEMRFHDCLRAQARGASVVLPGHYGSERFAMDSMARSLQALLPELQVWASQREHDPLQQ